MKKPDNFSEKLSELKSFSSYLNRILDDGSFYNLPFPKDTVISNTSSSSTISFGGR